MGLIVDVLLIGFIIFIVVSSSRKGFISSFLDTFSTFISAIISFTFCNQVADWAYDLFVKDLVKTEFLQALDDVSGGASLTEKVSAMIDSLPVAAVQVSNYFGVNVEALKSSLMGGYNASNEQLVELVTEQIAYDIMIDIIRIICLIALFVVLSLLIRFASQFFSHTLEKIPLVGSLNSILGGAFGLVKACIIVVALGVFLSIIVATAQADSPMLLIEDSVIYGIISGFNPVGTAVN